MATWPSTPGFPPKAISLPYPRLINVEAFHQSGQAQTFTRYGAIIGAFNSAPVGELKALGASTLALFYIESRAASYQFSFNGLTIYPGWLLCLAGTTLTAAVTDTSSTTLTVASSTSFTVNAWLLCDQETMLITAIPNGTTLTVQRGFKFAAQTHLNGAVIRPLAALPTYGLWLLNLTAGCPRDPINNQMWSDYLPQVITQAMAAQPWDGVFLDEQAYVPSDTFVANIDANNDNVADAATGWQAGQQTITTAVRSQNPGALVFGNAGIYLPYSNGQYFEHIPYYQSPGLVYWEGWYNLRAQQDATVNPNVLTPVSVLSADMNNVGPPGTADLQAIRFALGTALLDNGFFSFGYGTLSYGQTWFFDEYDNGQGSSLTIAATNASTTLTLATGTGSRFAIGNVVRVPNDQFSLSGLKIDDEQMLVTGITGDVLTVTRGYNGTFASSHAVPNKVMTDAQIAAGIGWLGQPTGAAVSLITPGTNLLTNGDFETFTGDLTAAGWTFASQTGSSSGIAMVDTRIKQSGTVSLRADVSVATPLAPSGLAVYQDGISITSGTTYTISFYAKCDNVGQTVQCTMQQNFNPFTSRLTQVFNLSPGWSYYNFVFVAANTETLKLQFNFAATVGNVWIDNVSVWVGDPNLWQRDFDHGRVIVNGTRVSKVVSLPASTYRRINGTQDTTTNSGATVTSVTIPSQDALILVHL